MASAARTTVQITMPQMGDSVTEGTVLEWHKQVGDPVAAEETVLEVSTDKVDAEVPAPASGRLSRILVEVDQTVAVGTVLAEIESDHGAPASAADPESPASSDNGGKDAEAALVEVTFPAMGDSVAEGTVLEWHKQVGDAVAADETVVEVSTDKVDAEVPSPVAGTVAEILAEVDQTVAVDTVLFRVATAGAPQPRTPAEAPSARGQAAPSPPQPKDAGGGNGAGPPASPVAERAAEAHGIDLGGLAGSGPRGRVLKSDVLAAAKGNGAAAAPPTAAPPAAAPPAAASTKPLRGPAAMLARAMDESRSIPTATSFRTVAVQVLDERRRALKEAGKRLSFTHLIAWAIVEASAGHPVMAHSFAEIEGTPHRVDPGGVSLGLAVDVERRDGSRSLVVPVLRDAGALDFVDFVATYDDLVAGARDNKLPPDAYSGANITLTNPGGIGTVASVPRLMPGQGTIIATGAIAYPPGLARVGPARLRELGVEKVMTMTSTYDHRVIQGAESGAFLRRIDQLLQGEDGFYESVFESLGLEAPVLETPETPQDGGAGGTTAAAVTAEDPAPTPVAPTITSDVGLLQAVQAATSVVKAHRTHGHLAANLDPLGSKPPGDPALDPETVNLTPELMEAIPASILRVAVAGETFADALPHLHDTYCGTIAYEIEHISDHQQRVWLRQTIEWGEHRQSLDAEGRKRLLRRLSKVEAMESYLHKAFLGKKQFSIEGLDVLIPMLDQTIEELASAGAEEVVIGMAHRGRLNVLAHTLGHPYEAILAEFEGEASLEVDTAVPSGGTGDVKYHHGATGTYPTRAGPLVTVSLSPNPSHLEFVDPVIEGRARADQTDRTTPSADHDPNAAVAVLIHGDAAFPGQGVVAETLNLQALDGYTTGGTIHIITNNQLGFTTDPLDARSTRYASDMAKGFDVPIIHVNADDVEACVAATRLAVAFRQKFGRDSLIDLIGYRRYGHNETDEPAYTQPEMYERVKGHPAVRQLFAERLVEQGATSSEEADAMATEAYAAMADAHAALKATIGHPADEEEPDADPRAVEEPHTAVEAERVRALNEALLTVPEGFTVHRKLRSQLERRLETVGEAGGIDWAQAEALAFASLLSEGVPIRFTGQDTERGTFSHRHLVLHDAETGATHTPIQHLPDSTVPFELHNSPLSEIATIGFEYGYSVQAPEALVLWEAQFGDFVNSAQVIVDQFLVSGLAKWGQTTRLTLLLPHGQEGSGPEHSSGRLERFLQLAAEGNIRVANTTTPAQYFHLLRRQALISLLRPLVVMTPKSLLRLPASTSRLEDLTDDSFHVLLDDPTGAERREQVTRLVLCTGKVYFDIDLSEARGERDNAAVARVELLYPFPRNELIDLMARYPNLDTVVWAQEEPRNMGARMHMQPRLMQILPKGVEFEYVGRQLRASPAVGYSAAHRAEQHRIVRAALGLG